ncbi:LacI family DNA-binding transcriptional regulator [Actinosynnema sp. NPDC020468]|uniref:LacI family DNA-binding transcriptional regulator n=1 Tax=Actinosynnema sp. NPDC020468 TaxID=3154488 RepID=UPI0034022255
MPPPTSDGAPHRTTIAHIAAEAGVSVPTVSKVVNGRPDVAPETRERVEAAIRRHDYRRRADTRRSTAVELVFGDLTSPRTQLLLQGAEESATAHHLSLTVSTPTHPGWLDALIGRKPLAVVATTAALPRSDLAKLAARAIPVVMVDPTAEPPPDTPSVGATNWTGAVTATRHLLTSGHERIALIAGPPDDLPTRARLDGYRAALETAGHPFDPTLVHHTAPTPSAAATAATALLSLPTRPTAIFACSDLQALGVYEAARRHALHIPDDLSVVGFDDLPLSAWTSPPLTTIRQPLRDMATTATTLAISLAEGRTPPHPNQELPTTLTLRSSTTPPSFRPRC